MPTSYDFRIEFIDRKSLVVECECGAIHYDATSKGDYEEGEFEKLESQAGKAPDKYISHPDYTSVVMIDGKQLAVDCPCDWLKNYEDFIWNHRRNILGYLKRRCSNEAEQAKQESDLANEAAETLQA